MLHYAAMKNRRLRLVVLHSVIVLLASFASLRASTPLQANEPQLDKPVQSATEPPRQSRSRLRTLADKLPVYFIENAGQTDSRVAYYVRGADKLIYFAPEGLTFVLNSYPQRDGGAARAPAESALLVDAQLEAAYHTSLAVKLNFVGADPNVRPLGEDRAPTLISYFHGDRDNWRTGLRTYTRLVYPDLWPGIDLVYSGTVQRLKYQFVVKPNADPQQIKLRYRGAESVSVTAAGKLEVKTSGTTFEDDRPIAYQEIDGQPLEVPVSYCLDDDETDGRSYGFRLGVYDSNKPLIIDPAILVYAGFVGGSGNDRGNAIAVDADGNAYITGETNSTQLTFPDKAGPDRLYNGGVDAFVAKVNAAGTALVYAGYIGGSGDERGNGIAVDSAGAVYVTGETSSMQTSFPVTGGPDIFHNGGVDAFVAKLNADGTSLIYAGYVGGSGDDRANAIALEPGCASNCRAYITGETNSTEASFPETAGSLDTFGGGVDAFVAQVDDSGAALVYAGYIGGSGDDRGNAVAADGAGNAYVTGETNSGQASFPETVGPDLTYNGGVDAFVAEVNAGGTTVVFAGYIGGLADDRAKGVAVDAAGGIYIVGETSSTAASFPDKVGPDRNQNGGFDAFVVKICADTCVDLTVAQTDLPDPVRVGDDITYTVTVTNDGPDDATNVVLEDEVPAGITIVSATPSVGTCSITTTISCDLGDLTNGSSATVTIVATTTAKGTLLNKVSVTADQTDTDGSNSANTERTVATLGNLVLRAFTTAKAAIPGTDIVIDDTTFNGGAVGSQDSTTRFYLSADRKLDGADVLLGSRAIPALGAKTGNSGSTTVTIPLGTVLGRFFLLGLADADNSVGETREANKETRTLKVTRPDLEVSALRAPQKTSAGALITVEDTTINKEPVASGGSTTKFYLSTDKVFGGDALLGSRAIPALGPEAKSAGSTTVTIPLATAPGKYFLIGVADADGAIAETNETDNTRARAITVGP